MKRILLACVLSAVVTPLLAQGAWNQLFDGKDFTGWTIGGGQANGFGSAARAAGAGNRGGGDDHGSRLFFSRPHADGWLSEVVP